MKDQKKINKSKQDESSSSSDGKNVLFDDTSSENTIDKPSKKSSVDEQSHKSSRELSEESKHQDKSKIQVKKIGESNVIVRQVESKTTVIMQKSKDLSQSITPTSIEVKEIKKEDQIPVGATKVTKPNEDEQDLKLDSLSEKPQKEPTPKKVQSPVYDYDFTKIKVKKPITEEVPLQQVVKINFNANNPYGIQQPKQDITDKSSELRPSKTEENLRNEIKAKSISKEKEDEVNRKRTETIESIQSDAALTTPPFTIKNRDLVHTHEKFKDVVPKLDFTKLKKRSKSKKKSSKKLIEEEIDEKQSRTPKKQSPKKEPPKKEPSKKEPVKKEPPKRIEEKKLPDNKENAKIIKKGKFMEDSTIMDVKSSKTKKTDKKNEEEKQKEIIEQKESDLELESFGGSSADMNKNVDKSMLTQSQSISKQGNSKIIDLSSSFNQTKASNQNQLGASKPLGSTYSSKMYNQPLNQNVAGMPQKIIISKDAAEKARKEREEQREKVLSEKPEIYYKAQAELREQKLREKLMKEKIEKEKKLQEEQELHAKAKAEAEEIDAAQKKSKKKDKTKYDPNVRLEVESSKSDQAYEAKSEESEGEFTYVWESEESEEEVSEEEEQRRIKEEKERLQKEKEENERLLKAEKERLIKEKKLIEAKKKEEARVRRIEEQRRKEEKLREEEQKRKATIKKGVDISTIIQKREEDKQRLEEMRRMELLKKKKEMDEKKMKALGLKRKDESSSSDEEDSVPNDIPSSERQRHMNPLKFVARAQELVMQQIISNASFGPTPSRPTSVPKPKKEETEFLQKQSKHKSRDDLHKKNKSLEKGKEKDKSKHSKDKNKSKGKEEKSNQNYKPAKANKNEIKFDSQYSKRHQSKADKKKKPSLPSEYDPDEYTIVYEDEEEESEESKRSEPEPPPKQQKRAKKFYI